MFLRFRSEPSPIAFYNPAREKDSPSIAKTVFLPSTAEWAPHLHRDYLHRIHECRPHMLTPGKLAARPCVLEVDPSSRELDLRPMLRDVSHDQLLDIWILGGRGTEQLTHGALDGEAPLEEMERLRFEVVQVEQVRQAERRLGRRGQGELRGCVQRLEVLQTSMHSAPPFRT